MSTMLENLLDPRIRSTKMSNNHRSALVTAALLSVAAGLGAPTLELGEVRRRQAETDEERQARELAGINEMRRRKAVADERIAAAAAKRERRALKRLSNG